MIVVLFEPEDAAMSTEVADTLATAFHGNVQIKLVAAVAGCSWSIDPDWDDLLIILYKNTVFNQSGNSFVEEFVRVRGSRALLLPVALDVDNQRPPSHAEKIKSLPYNEEAKGREGLLVQRVGGMLGLRVQGRDSKIFISYRESDGVLIATQIYEHLKFLGHTPWRDQAIELDGSTKILPGTEVQTQIDDALSSASLVLLLDTAMSPDSLWIRHEVDTADAMLIPTLPICFRTSLDTKKGPRFRSLLALQRWVAIETPPPGVANPLSAEELDFIVLELETYLCEIFRRKCRVPFLVQREFLQHGFDWTVKSQPLFMFGSLKGGGRLHTRVITHCSIFEQIYKPSMHRFKKFLDNSDKSNYSLFVYDGELLSDRELAELLDEDSHDMLVLHHQELSSLIGSNFSTLGKL